MDEAACRAKSRPMWIVRATQWPNNLEVYPFQDSEAALWRSVDAKAQRRKSKLVRNGTAKVIKKPSKKPIDAKNGGHDLMPTLKKGLRSGWMCTVCRMTTSNARVARTQVCRGQPLRLLQGDEHTTVQSGMVT